MLEEHQAVDILPCHFRKCWLQRNKGESGCNKHGENFMIHAIAASHAHLPQALLNDGKANVANRLPASQFQESLKLDGALEKNRSEMAICEKTEAGTCSKESGLAAPCSLNSSLSSDVSIAWPETPAGSAPSLAGTSPTCSSSGQNPCSNGQSEGDTLTHSSDAHWGSCKRPRKVVRNDSNVSAPVMASPLDATKATSASGKSAKSEATKPANHLPTCKSFVPVASIQQTADIEMSPRGGGRTCVYCGTQRTPLWRNGPCGIKSLCNACGIRFKKLSRKDGVHAAERVYGPKGGMALAASLECVEERGRATEEKQKAPSTPAIQQAAAKSTGSLRKQKQESTAAALVASIEADGSDSLRSSVQEGLRVAGYDPLAHTRKRNAVSQDSRHHSVIDANSEDWPEGKRVKVRGAIYRPTSSKAESGSESKNETKMEDTALEEDEEGAASALMALLYSV